MPRTLPSVENSFEQQLPAFGIHVSINIQELTRWHSFVKRVFDLVAAAIGLMLSLPLMILIAIRVKFDSPGPVFYLQERIGFRGMPFTIYKFRSMYQHAEASGPSLSFANDPRITPWGRIIRRWKLDELPQLFNILLGDMSLVGPRPERRYYIERVNKHCPYFKYLHQVRPGLTSIGMIRFGYAQNVHQIIERLRFDMEYMEHCSLLLDLSIIFYTIQSFLDGKIKNDVSRHLSAVN